MSEEKEEIQFDENDFIFEPKTLFSDGFQPNLIRAKFQNYMHDAENKAPDIAIDEKKSDEDYCEPEYCIIDDNKDANEEYKLNKKDYNAWIINKIMRKTDFDALFADTNKQFKETTLFWQFIKKFCAKYKKDANKRYQQFILFAKNKNKEMQKNHPQLIKYLSFDQISAIYCYGLTEFYKDLNISLRSKSDAWSDFCGTLSVALYKLPFIDFERNTVFRGLYLSDKEKSKKIREGGKYKKGSIVRWSDFTSTTLNEQVAQIYSGEDIIYEIQSGFHGKDISAFSPMQHEEEVLFNFCSHFLIVDTEEKNKIFYVTLKELPFAWNAKTILWVDDNPGGNKNVMEECERVGIMIIPRLSTQGALEFFDFMSYALDRDKFEKFRVITDMSRDEWVNDDKEEKENYDPEAGATLILQLRERGYKNEVCIYTSNKEKAINKCKNKNVYNESVVVFEYEKDVKQFALFEK